MRSGSEKDRFLDVAQLVAHLVRDQEVAGSSPVIQTRKAPAEMRVFYLSLIFSIFVGKTNNHEENTIYCTDLAHFSGDSFG